MGAAPVARARRSRHIKCDETPNACRNCTSTGRKCDGYNHYRLPSRKTPPLSKPTKSLILSLPGLESDERRCLQFFEHNTIPMLVGYADSEVWQRLVLQMCHREPAVCHAVVALSAFHEDYERSSMNLKSKSKPDHRHHHFALEQYNRSMAMLRRRIQSNDPQVRGITLMCCIVFVILELLEGDYTNAFAHLHQGLNILNTHQPIHHQHALATERILARAFLHLKTPKAYWNGPDVVVTGHPPKGSVTEVAYENIPIDSIAEAKERLRLLMNNIFHFQSLCNLFFRGETDDPILTLSAKQRTLQHNLTDFTLDLKTFISANKPNTSLWTLRETRSMDVILVHVATLTSMLGCCLDTTELGYDDFLPEFTRINDLCERIIASFVTEYGSYENLPSMITDVGVLPSLFWTGVRCRDAEIREKSLQLLKVWPHREGFYDSYLIWNICRGLIAIEDEGRESEMGVIPQSARVHTHKIEVAEDRSLMVIRYVMAGGDGEMERVVLLE
ncbi:hypothetical protein AbraIFM66951_000350 [Aspergillus brasiliensis]|uniref:Zn(2)-C6 fungal-type domain-containing protein n=1 Tax=Aspergillus brasiliensis TaxID=319629 RepID=A0A9W5YLM1_9EURO|nr:hypothetical protein AbraCBS73388_000336 [Aspergillus brasiliensis]GKZ42029.1 hypothetical protein AbraIFM66951_000350 [Aspergillus brasiliensis]